MCHEVILSVVEFSSFIFSLSVELFANSNVIVIMSATHRCIRLVSEHCRCIYIYGNARWCKMIHKWVLINFVRKPRRRRRPGLSSSRSEWQPLSNACKFNADCIMGVYQWSASGVHGRPDASHIKLDSSELYYISWSVFAIYVDVVAQGWSVCLTRLVQMLPFPNINPTQLSECDDLNKRCVYCLQKKTQRCSISVEN